MWNPITVALNFLPVIMPQIWWKGKFLWYLDSAMGYTRCFERVKMWQLEFNVEIKEVMQFTKKQKADY